MRSHDRHLEKALRWALLGPLLGGSKILRATMSRRGGAKSLLRAISDFAAEVIFSETGRLGERLRAAQPSDSLPEPAPKMRLNSLVFCLWASSCSGLQRDSTSSEG